MVPVTTLVATVFNDFVWRLSGAHVNTIASLGLLFFFWFEIHTASTPITSGTHTDEARDITPVAGLIFETKNRAIFLERFFGRGITAREQLSRAVILARF